MNKYLLGGLAILLMGGAYFAGTKQLGFITPKVESASITPSPTPQPTTSLSPTPSPTTKPKVVSNQPSTRALKVAGSVYAMYVDESQRVKIREYAGISKSNENTEIIQYALWLDKNQGYLAKVEAAIENYKQNAQVQALPQPLHCTTNTIGDYTYTNCY